MNLNFFNKKRNEKIKSVHKFSIVTFDSYKDWNRLLLTSLFWVIVFATWSGYVFWTIQSGDAFYVTPTKPPVIPSFNITNIQAIENNYKAKAILLQQFASSSPHVVDPSL